MLGPRSDSPLTLAHIQFDPGAGWRLTSEQHPGVRHLLVYVLGGAGTLDREGEPPLRLGAARPCCACPAMPRDDRRGRPHGDAGGVRRRADGRPPRPAGPARSSGRAGPRRRRRGHREPIVPGAARTRERLLPSDDVRRGRAPGRGAVALSPLRRDHLRAAGRRHLSPGLGPQPTRPDRPCGFPRGRSTSTRTAAPTRCTCSACSPRRSRSRRSWRRTRSMSSRPLPDVRSPTRSGRQSPP